MARQKAEAIHAKAEEARKNSSEAEKQANEAAIDKQKILADNLILQHQVEQERLERLQLERSLAPCGLGQGLRQALIGQLQKSQPTK